MPAPGSCARRGSGGVRGKGNAQWACRLPMMPARGRFVPPTLPTGYRKRRRERFVCRGNLARGFGVFVRGPTGAAGDWLAAFLP